MLTNGSPTLKSSLGPWVVVAALVAFVSQRVAAGPIIFTDNVGPAIRRCFSEEGPRE
jgi:hypothetical protein